MFLVICLYCGFFFFVFVHVWYTYRNRMIAGSRGIVGRMLLISLKLEPSFYHCLFIWDGKKNVCVYLQLHEIPSIEPLYNLFIIFFDTRSEVQQERFAQDCLGNSLLNQIMSCDSVLAQ